MGRRLCVAMGRQIAAGNEEVDGTGGGRGWLKVKWNEERSE